MSPIGGRRSDRRLIHQSAGKEILRSLFPISCIETHSNSRPKGCRTLCLHAYPLVINQPVEKVFDYVSNPINLPEWQGPPTEIRNLQQSTLAQLREGDRFTTVLQFLGRRYETPTEVSAYEPNRRLSCRGTGGPVPTQITFIFEEVPGGTRFIHSQEVEPGDFFGLAEPLFEIEARRQLRNDLQTLQNLLEANEKQ
jgi:uncharacterized protein YndB with AHSA1/START domain